MPDYKKPKSVYEQNKEDIHRIQGELQKLKSDASINPKLLQAIIELTAVVGGINNTVVPRG
jgi:hypothetical protein